MEFGIEIPPDFLLVGKELMTIEGIGKELDPDLDVFTETRPYFLTLLKRRYSPQKIGGELWRGLEKLSGAAYDLPVQMQEVLEDLRLGRFTMKTQDPGLPRVMDRLGRRVFSGLVVAALIASGAWLLSHERTFGAGIALLVLGAAVMLSHVALDLRRG
jgi:ubiquinone biosynthesis protein